jgi:hypothetical protein
MLRPVNGALWPLPAMLAVWLFVALQAAGIWVGPHRRMTLAEQCARLQLSSGSGGLGGTGGTGAIGLGNQR